MCDIDVGEVVLDEEVPDGEQVDVVITIIDPRGEAYSYFIGVGQTGDVEGQRVPAVMGIGEEYLLFEVLQGKCNFEVGVAHGMREYIGSRFVEL